MNHEMAGNIMKSDNDSEETKMDKVKEHIKWEWEKFSLELLCTSKQNIFSKASEIVNKKFIYQTLLNDSYIFDEREATIICASDCIIDTIYNKIFLEENNGNCSSEKVIEVLHCYVVR